MDFMSSSMTDEQARQLAVKLPLLSFKVFTEIPSPSHAALFTGISGACVALILGKSPLKWALCSAAIAGLSVLGVKGIYAAGLMAGSVTTVDMCVRNPADVQRIYEEFLAPSPGVRGFYDSW